MPEVLRTGEGERPELELAGTDSPEKNHYMEVVVYERNAYLSASYF